MDLDYFIFSLHFVYQSSLGINNGATILDYRLVISEVGDQREYDHAGGLIRSIDVKELKIIIKTTIEIFSTYTRIYFTKRVLKYLSESREIKLND